MLQQITSKKGIQLDLLVHLHGAKSLQMSHSFKTLLAVNVLIREIVILTDGNTEDF